MTESTRRARERQFRPPECSAQVASGLADVAADPPRAQHADRGTEQGRQRWQQQRVAERIAPIARLEGVRDHPTSNGPAHSPTKLLTAVEMAAAMARIRSFAMFWMLARKGAVKKVLNTEPTMLKSRATGMSGAPSRAMKAGSATRSLSGHNRKATRMGTLNVCPAAGIQRYQRGSRAPRRSA